MKEICQIEKCTGCRLCASVCSKNCISFSKEINGHAYPVIDEDICINCNKCAKSCIANQENVAKHNAAFGCYAAWHKDSHEQYESASAGLATALSRAVIKQGGKVYGCALNDKLEAVHIGIENESELDRLRKSKYALSRIDRSVFEDIKAELNYGRTCLFIGVGCQCDAIRKYLNKENDNLIIVDLLCRGGASTKVLLHHIDYLSKKHHLKDINNVTFRGGDYDCRIALRHDNEVKFAGAQYVDEYFFAFMEHILYRKSCFNCQYASTERVGDITLADFWGLDDKLVKKYNFLKRGVNLLLINTEKGKKLFDSISSEINIIERLLEEAVQGNETLHCPTPKPERYDLFWTNMNEYSFEEALHKTYSAYYRNIKKKKVINTILIPYWCLRYRCGLLIKKLKL